MADLGIMTLPLCKQEQHGKKVRVQLPEVGLPTFVQPSLVLPTAIALDDAVSKASSKQHVLEEHNVHIGQEAVDLSLTHSVYYPVRQGVVSERPLVMVLDSCGRLPTTTHVNVGVARWTIGITWNRTGTTHSPGKLLHMQAWQPCHLQQGPLSFARQRDGTKLQHCC